MRWLGYLAVLGVIGIGTGLWVTRAVPLAEAAIPDIAGDPVEGERIYYASGCSGCHAAPDASADARNILAGGQKLASPFGDFGVPNISPHPEKGIGDWSLHDLANALRKGVSPEGQHYFPAFPYTTYARMTLEDIADLRAYLDTLPASDADSPGHDLPFPFSVRRGVGAWKLLNLSDDWVMTAPPSEEAERGRYLVEALGHCAECHTPRDFTGGLDRARWMEGAPNPSGKGTIPGITPSRLGWTATDIAYYLETGFTPDFDSAGGKMAEVVNNTGKLPPEDRAAIAAYLMALD